MNIHSHFSNLWSDNQEITIEPRNMTTVSQSTSENDGITTGTSTSGSSQTTYSSSVEVTPGLTSSRRTTYIEDFPTFRPFMLPPPSAFFDPFRPPMFQPVPMHQLFDRRGSREPIRTKRRASPQNNPSSGYNSSNSGTSLNCNSQQPIYEFPNSESDMTPINSPVPSTTSTCDTQSSSKSFKESLVRVLDEVDARVRFLRDTANELEEEKEKLLSVLNNLEKRNELSMIEEIDREEVIATSKQLTQVLSSVNISIASKRDEDQEKAFNQVNDKIKSLSDMLTSPKNAEEFENAKLTVQIYLNTCTSANDPRVAIDEKFQKAIIACTIDDQKKFRKKLESLHKYTI